MSKVANVQRGVFLEDHLPKDSYVGGQHPDEDCHTGGQENSRTIHLQADWGLQSRDWR